MVFSMIMILIVGATASRREQNALKKHLMSLPTDSIPQNPFGKSAQYMLPKDFLPGFVQLCTRLLPLGLVPLTRVEEVELLLSKLDIMARALIPHMKIKGIDRHGDFLFRWSQIKKVTADKRLKPHEKVTRLKEICRNLGTSFTTYYPRPLFKLEEETSELSLSTCA